MPRKKGASSIALRPCPYRRSYTPNMFKACSQASVFFVPAIAHMFLFPSYFTSYVLHFPIYVVRLTFTFHGILSPSEIRFTNDERRFMVPRVVPESLHAPLVAIPKAACECLGFRTYWEA